MFEKIWYPDEVLVAVLGVRATIFFTPILLLSFIVSFEVIVALFTLMILAGSVIKVRGEMTIELDEEEADTTRRLIANRKRIMLGMVITFAVLLFIAFLLIPKEGYAIFPVVSAMLLTIPLGLMGLSSKVTIRTASFLTVLATLIALTFSLKSAAFTAVVLLVFSLPECIAASIRTERLLKGDLKKKLPPSMAREEDQEQV